MPKKYDWKQVPVSYLFLVLNAMGSGRSTHRLSLCVFVNLVKLLQPVSHKPDRVRSGEGLVEDSEGWTANTSPPPKFTKSILGGLAERKVHSPDFCRLSASSQAFSCLSGTHTHTLTKRQHPANVGEGNAQKDLWLALAHHKAGLDCKRRALGGSGRRLQGRLHNAKNFSERSTADQHRMT